MTDFTLTRNDLTKTCAAITGSTCSLTARAGEFAT
jgi:hypothetical protein